MIITVLLASFSKTNRECQLPFSNHILPQVTSITFVLKWHINLERQIKVFLYLFDIICWLSCTVTTNHNLSACLNATVKLTAKTKIKHVRQQYSSLVYICTTYEWCKYKNIAILNSHLPRWLICSELQIFCQVRVSLSWAVLNVCNYNFMEGFLPFLWL